MTSMSEGVIIGLHHHPLSRWVESFPDDIDLAKPFSGEYLEPLNGKHEILGLPYTTSPLTIPQALSELPLGNVVISTGWSIDPRSVEFKMVSLLNTRDRRNLKLGPASGISSTPSSISSRVRHGRKAYYNISARAP